MSLRSAQKSSPAEGCIPDLRRPTDYFRSVSAIEGINPSILLVVIPAKAGISMDLQEIPAFAGMTGKRGGTAP